MAKVPETHIRCMDCDILVLRADIKWTKRSRTQDAVCSLCFDKSAKRKAADKARREAKRAAPADASLPPVGFSHKPLPAPEHDRTCGLCSGTFKWWDFTARPYHLGGGRYIEALVCKPCGAKLT